MQIKFVFRFVSFLLLLTLLISSNFLSVAADVNQSNKTVKVTLLSAESDASVNAEFPDQNYGLEKTLYVKSSPASVGYVRFNTSEMPEGAIQSVILRVYLQGGDPSDLLVSAVQNTDWSEDTITYQNAPLIKDTIAKLERSSVGEWVEFDLSSYFRGKGIYTLALTSITQNSSNLIPSREADGHEPHLAITIEELGALPADINSVTDIQPTDTSLPLTESTPTDFPTQPSLQLPNLEPTIDLPDETTSVDPTSTLQEPPPTVTDILTPEVSPTKFPTQPSLQLPSPTSDQNPEIQADAAALKEYIFVPEADAYVNRNRPKTNYGKLSVLRVDNSPKVKSYLRFNVDGLGEQAISKARLFIYSNSGSNKGIAIKKVANNTWGEMSIKYTNAPEMGTTLSSVPVVRGGTWIGLDVTSAVTGENRISFGLITPGSTSINLSSRETGSRSPFLVITVNGETTTSIPTISPDPTATSAPAILPTLTPTPMSAPTSTETSTPIIVSSSTPTDIPPITATATLGTTLTPLQSSTATATATGTPLPSSTATTTRTPTPIFTHTVTADSTNDPVLVGAGDIASCSSIGDEATERLLDAIPGTVFTTGDNVYDSGSISEYVDCYNPTWGRFKARTMPSVGNHDYITSGATGYYAYFGAAAGVPGKGYYSYDLGKWHIVVLNSEISTSTSSEQVTWLRQDLAANPVTCTLAYWHRPRFSSGAEHGSSTSVQPLWQALYDYQADVIINGHDHTYERFAPQSPTGASDPNGIREFVAGMGGRSHYGFGNILPNSEVQNSDTFGVLKLTLHDTNYDWEFVPVAGKTFTDSGNASCIQSK